MIYHMQILLSIRLYKTDPMLVSISYLVFGLSNGVMVIIHIINVCMCVFVCVVLQKVK